MDGATKVEKILKGILDLIPSPSPSVKIQILDGKVCLRCKGLPGVSREAKSFTEFEFGGLVR